MKAKELGRDDEWINSEIGWNYDRIDKYDEAYKYLKKLKIWEEMMHGSLENMGGVLVG